MTHFLSIGSDISKNKQIGHDGSSESELDCSKLIQTLDSDGPTVLEGRSFDNLHTENPATITYSSNDIMQTLVYQTILEQLSSIGKRLDKLKKIQL